MGQLDQFAKDTFALEAASVTHGGVSWQLPPELGMSEVRLDGLLRVHDPSLLTTLAPPWSLVEQADEVLESLPMSAATYDDLSNFTIMKTDDPEVRARRHMILSRFLEVLPEAREKLIEEGRVEEARKSLRGCSVRAGSRSRPTTKRGSMRAMSRIPSSAG